MSPRPPLTTTSAESSREAPVPFGVVSTCDARRSSGVSATSSISTTASTRLGFREAASPHGGHGQSCAGKRNSRQGAAAEDRPSRGESHHCRRRAHAFRRQTPPSRAATSGAYRAPPLYRERERPRARHGDRPRQHRRGRRRQQPGKSSSSAIRTGRRRRSPRSAPHPRSAPMNSPVTFRSSSLLPSRRGQHLPRDRPRRPVSPGLTGHQDARSLPVLRHCHPLVAASTPFLRRSNQLLLAEPTDELPGRLRAGHPARHRAGNGLGGDRSVFPGEPPLRRGLATTVSTGFFFAPMIPLSEGRRGSSRPVEERRTAGRSRGLSETHPPYRAALAILVFLNLDDVRDHRHPQELGHLGADLSHLEIV